MFVLEFKLKGSNQQYHRIDEGNKTAQFRGLSICVFGWMGKKSVLTTCINISRA